MPFVVEEHDLEVLRRRLSDAERKATVAEIASTLAHELKNPLAPIQGYAQLLRARLAGVSEAERPRFEEGLSIIEREARRMEGLLRSFLEDAYRAFEVRRTEERFALGAVVAEAARLVRGRRGPSTLSWEGLEVLGDVRGDADSIRSALVNVLDNALDAVRDRGGHVSIRGRRDGRWHVVEVVDNGPGFGADPARYLRPFVTSKERGTGLGLTLALTAVEGVGGELRLADDAGGGASVQMRLPVV